VLVIVTADVLVALTTCNTEPVGNAALGRFVALAKLIEAGVPSTGAVSVSGASKPFWFIVEMGII
jgi:hypothetical protein